MKSYTLVTGRGRGYRAAREEEKGGEVEGGSVGSTRRSRISEYKVHRLRSMVMIYATNSMPRYVEKRVRKESRAVALSLRFGTVYFLDALGFTVSFHTL